MNGKSVGVFTGLALVVSAVAGCGPIAEEASVRGGVGGVPIPAPSFAPSPVAAGAQGSQGAGWTDCSADESQMTPTLKGPNVGGAVTFFCTDKPEQWSAALFLKYRSSSNVPVWEEKDQDSAGDVDTRLFLYEGCLVGDWQLRYVVTGVDANGGPIALQGAKEKWISTCP